MTPAAGHLDRMQWAAVECFAQRLHDRPTPAPWLLTLVVPALMADYLASTLQCRATVDDFGNLVPVEPWL